MKLSEEKFWQSARLIIHFVGICGAGKSTLSSRLAGRIGAHGGRVVGTVDYDPHTPDHERANERAFSRELDLMNIKTGGGDALVHKRILDHTLAMLDSWKASDANVVIVDRWYESYDDLPDEYVREIEAAITDSGFRLCRVFLVVAKDADSNDKETIRERMLLTKSTRPSTWWEEGPGDLDRFVDEEQAYQEEYAHFMESSPVPYLKISTRDMDWNQYEDLVANALIQG